MRERVGVAVNARSLQWREHESAVDRVAALAFGDRLAGLLWRLKYGLQREAFKPAVLLLARAIRARARAKRWRAAPPDIWQRIAARAITEWLEPPCETCGGRGIIGLERGTVRSVLSHCDACRGTGRMYYVSSRSGARLYRVCKSCCGKGLISDTKETKRSTVRQCADCLGTGRRLPTIDERALALGLPAKLYAERWDTRMDEVIRMLDHLDRKMNDDLNAQLDETSCA